MFRRSAASITICRRAGGHTPNGNILFAASPGFGQSPTHFFEFTSATSSPANSINQVADPVFNASTSVPSSTISSRCRTARYS